MGKHSVIDDKIPLTHTRSNITYETRARFDSLLHAALNQGRDNAGQQHGSHDNVIIYDIIECKGKNASVRMQILT
jgi:hypothetical protein